MTNQKGFGLVEVMVSVMILSIVALGTAQAINNAMLVQQTADVKANLTSLVTSTAGVAANQITCTQAVTSTTQTFGQTFQFNSIQNGTVLSNYNLTINSLTYDNPVLVGTGSDGTKAYYGAITLNASSNVAVYGSKSFASRTILYIYLTVNPAGQITGCGSIMPTLATSTPIPPAATPAAPAQDPEFVKGCSDIGGTASNGTCTIHSEPCDGK